MISLYTLGNLLLFLKNNSGHSFPVTFKDSIMADKIMKTSDPKMHKRYGRKVQNFEKNVWAEKSKEVVREGSLLKVVPVLTSSNN